LFFRTGFRLEYVLNVPVGTFGKAQNPRKTSTKVDLTTFACTFKSTEDYLHFCPRSGTRLRSRAAAGVRGSRPFAKSAKERGTQYIADGRTV
jgi:hypothetical protein